MKLLFSPTFLRKSKRLLKRNTQLLSVVQATLIALENDVFNPSLRTHKLKGDFSDYWSCSVNYEIRILFKFVKDQNEDAILLQSIGTHDEVY